MPASESEKEISLSQENQQILELQVADSPSDVAWKRNRKYTAQQLEPFREVYNRCKPDKWRKCDFLNTERVSKINERVIGEYGEQALRMWERSLLNAHHVPWVARLDWSMTTYLSSGQSRDRHWIQEFLEVKVQSPAKNSELTERILEERRAAAEAYDPTALAEARRKATEQVRKIRAQNYAS